MHTDSRSEAPLAPGWTLAELLSTWRFWGVCLAVVLLNMGNVGFGSIASSLAAEHDLSLRNLSHYYYPSMDGAWLGAFLAMIAARRFPRALLVTLALLCGAALTLLIVDDGASTSMIFRLCGLTQGMARTAAVILAASILAGARSERGDFAVAFGLMVVLSHAPGSLAGLPAGYAAGRWSLSIAVTGCIVLLACAAISAWTVGRSLFGCAARPRRQRTLPVRHRSPVALAATGLLIQFVSVAAAALVLYHHATSPWDDDRALQTGILCVVALAVLGGVIYAIYWCYRIHGEVASIEPSRRLFNARAAVCVALFVPFGFSIVLMTLVDVLNERAARATSVRRLGAARVALVSCVLPSVAMGMIQRAVNEASVAVADNASITSS